MTPKERLMPVGLLRRIVRLNDTRDGLLWLPRTDETHDTQFSASNWNSRHAGKPALSNRTYKGYLAGRIHGRVYWAHRVVWAIEHGAWPENFIDHINGIRTDNRPENLREATATENARNRALHRNNRSGSSGVFYNKRLRKFIAQIGCHGGNIHLGCFHSLEEARKVRAAEEVRRGYRSGHRAAR